MALLTAYWTLDVLLILINIVAALYFYFTAPYTYWKKRNVPDISTFPIFGNFLSVLSMQQHCTEFFNDCYESTTAPFVGIYIGHTPHLVLRDLNLVKHVLVKDFNIFTERPFLESKHDPMGTNNLFVIKNPHWKLLRTKLTPFFTSGRMRQMFTLMTEVGNRLTSHLESLVHDKEIIVDIKEVCASYSVDVITSCAFGIEANSFSEAQAEFRKIGIQVFDFNFRRGFEFKSFFFLPTIFKLMKLQLFGEKTEFLRNTFWQVLKDREASGLKRPDLVETLIKLKNDDLGNNLKFDGDTLVAQAVIFFNAGFETSASSMSFTLYQLSLNQNVQKKLRQEIINTLEKHENNLTYDCVADIKYLTLCIQETLRMYPILPFLNRECNKDYTFPDTSLTIEKGTPVIIPFYSYHMDAEYNPEPEKYIPERFGDENKPNLKAFSFLSFGEGPHNCIGERFGYLQTKIGLIHILKDFEVLRSNKTQVPLVFNRKTTNISTEKRISITLRKLT